MRICAINQFSYRPTFNAKSNNDDELKKLTRGIANDVELKIIYYPTIFI